MSEAKSNVASSNAESKTIQLTEQNIFLPQYRGRLTEGVTYNPSNDTLLWVDIIAGEVHRVRLSKEKPHSHEILKFEDKHESIGAIALTSNDNLILVCGKYGVAKGDFVSGKILPYFLKYPHESARLRSNDGIVDPWGHLWIGVMNDFPVTAQEGVKPEGKLYRINCHDLTIETMIEPPVYISNGLSFSANGKKLFWTDSLTHTIWQFDYDYITNTLSNKRKFVSTVELYPSFDSPEPDGLTMTKTGEIYSAVFSTGTVMHLDAHGNLVEKFTLPAQRITSVTIGGKNDDELYITTGHLKLDDPNAKIDANDRGSDLGGFLYKYTASKPLQGQTKNIWGGKVETPA